MQKRIDSATTTSCSPSRRQSARRRVWERLGAKVIAIGGGQ
jgi:hypothetical protein